MFARPCHEYLITVAGSKLHSRSKLHSPIFWNIFAINKFQNYLWKQNRFGLMCLHATPNILIHPCHLIHQTFTIGTESHVYATMPAWICVYRSALTISVIDTRTPDRGTQKGQMYSRRFVVITCTHMQQTSTKFVMHLKFRWCGRFALICLKWKQPYCTNKLLLGFETSGKIVRPPFMKSSRFSFVMQTSSV